MKSWSLPAVVSLFLLTSHLDHLGDIRLISRHPATSSFPLPRHPLPLGLGGRKTKMYSHHCDDPSSNSCQKAPPTNPPPPPSPPPPRRWMLACDKAPPNNPQPPPSPPPRRRRMLACDKAPPTNPPSPPPPPQGAMLACDKAPPTNPPPPPPPPPQRGTLACGRAPPTNRPPTLPSPGPQGGTFACNKAPPTNLKPSPSPPPPQGGMLACDKAPPTNNPPPPPPPPPPPRGATLAGWFKLQVLGALEIAKTQWHHFTAIFIAGMTFFTNSYAYDLFCISLVPRLLGRANSNIPVAPNPRHLPANISAAVNSVGLCSLAGPLLLGWLGNKLARKHVYVVV